RFRIDVIDVVGGVAGRGADNGWREEVRWWREAVVPLQPRARNSAFRHAGHAGKPCRATQTESAHQTVARRIVDAVTGANHGLLTQRPGQSEARPIGRVVDVTETLLASAALAIAQVGQRALQARTRVNNVRIE